MLKLVLKFKKLKINNIEYSYSLDKNLDTVKLWTKDNKFITKEGFKIGTKWKEIPKELQDSTYKLPGFGYYVELKSGWNLGFCIGNTCTDNYPFNKSEVIWIEKQMNKRVKEHNSLFKNLKKRLLTAVLAKFGRVVINGRNFLYIWLSPKWKGSGQYKPKLRKAGGTLNQIFNKTFMATRHF